MADRHPKRSARRDLREQRRAIAASRDLAEDGRAIAQHALDLLDQLGIPADGTVTAYESLPHEPPTDVLIDLLVRRGTRVLLPITLTDLDLDWYAVERHRFVPGEGPLRDDGVRKGRGLTAIAHADLVLTPGLAVDARGVRLGQGGGCYDRALPRRRAGVHVVTLLHPGEYSPVMLPRDEHDVPVDGVLTAEGVRWLRGRP